MKAVVIGFGIIAICLWSLTFYTICCGGEKEELQLKQQLLQERIMKCQAQGQLLQNEFTATQAELKDVTEKLKPFEAKPVDPKEQLKGAAQKPEPEQK